MVVNLRPDVPVEAEFLDAYEAMPRRAEWVRRMLLRGFAEEQRRSVGSVPKPLSRQSSMASSLSAPVSSHGGTLVKPLIPAFSADYAIGEGDDR